MARCPTAGAPSFIVTIEYIQRHKGIWLKKILNNKIFNSKE